MDNELPPDPDDYDCHGGLIGGLIVAVGFYVVVTSVLLWITG